jgi:hypothetical protein
MAMETNMNSEKIRYLARALDDDIEKHDIEKLVLYFSDECQIQLPGITLTGHKGLRKAIRWMYSYFKELTLVPVTIMIKDNIFFEEFVVKAKIAGRDLELNQAEVLEYDTTYKVKSIRLYFDRLELARIFSSNFIDRILIERVDKTSLKGLAEL